MSTEPTMMLTVPSRSIRQAALAGSMPPIQPPTATPTPTRRPSVLTARAALALLLQALETFAQTHLRPRLPGDHRVAGIRGVLQPEVEGVETQRACKLVHH